MHPQQSEHGAYADYEDGDGHGDGGRDGDGDGDFEGSQDPDTPSIPARVAFRRFWPMTKGLRGFLLIVWLCTVLNALTETVAILLFSDLTDHALQQGSLDAFWSPAAQWLGVAVAGAAVGFAGNSLAAWATERFVMRLREHVFDHVQQLPPHFFQRHRQGDLLSRLTADVEAIEQMVVSAMVGAASAAFSALFYAAAAFWLRWDLAAATFVLAPLFWLAARRFSGSIKSVSREGRVADGAITSVVEESLGNIVLTQAYDRRDAERRRLNQEAGAWFRAAVRSTRLNELYEQLVQVIETVCVLAVIGLGVWEISTGRMTLGQLLAFAAFLGYLYPPVRGLAQLGLTVTAATAGAERLIEILDVRPAVADPARTSESIGRPDGSVEVRDVSFRYPGADKAALEGLSFAVRPGELVIITGPSGAGKSTVSKLLLRFYDPDAGSVLLDGVPLNAFPLARLREYVTLLPQETLVLHDTVRANIACGRPGASEHAIVEAAKAADAHAFITGLPDGYDTRVDPNSARLSGGQLQRLAIARAILRDAPVLVLDEPTTGLDAMAARRVVRPLRRLMAGRTTIMITHDLNLAPDADRILVVDHGRIVETGRHDDLLSRAGAYARLHRSQNNALMDTGELRLPLFTGPEGRAEQFAYGTAHGATPGAVPGTAPGAVPGTAYGAGHGTAYAAVPGTVYQAAPGTAYAAVPGTAHHAANGNAYGTSDQVAYGTSDQVAYGTSNQAAFGTSYGAAGGIPTDPPYSAPYNSPHSPPYGFTADVPSDFPVTLPGGRPLFRDEVPWHGV
ncbi:ABC transporter ATP-binding protein [Streptomyces avermitilis]|uniref:ABC transporter ATP-binding protein n=2 Tax=Streptomyces TaxID=1883 RepID=Q82GM5_STRAW|nr:ABC transporter ATP-binding protein [Streptomyces avermitilis]OOV32271.1 ABC transporter ATP-binding protein [Streptomyces avermitilis]BAC71584.1 putative ABC transporter ATP-binding protein [Streptomyces avermitilis MA-4680 = NBRC 14893]